MKPERNIGKEIKDVGVLLIVVGVFLLGIIFLAIVAPSEALEIILNKCFLFLVFGGLLSILAGVIVRSIGKSKEAEFNSKK